MSANIGWIKEALTYRYPHIVKDKEADLDEDGKIEGNERLVDKNNDKVINDEEWWLYLERNKEIIKKKVEFIAWGAQIPETNIIHTILLQESEVLDWGKIKNAYTWITEIIKSVKYALAMDEEMHEKLQIKSTPQEKMKLVYRVLKERFQISYKRERLLAEGLAERKLDCDTFSFVFLALADELNWPLSLVHVSGIVSGRAEGHAFVRWQDAKVRFNFDQGTIRPDEYYQVRYHVPDVSIKKGVYLKRLSSRELQALHYTLCGSIMQSRFKFPEGALKVFNKAIKLYPTFAEAHGERGSARLLLGNFKGAIEDFNQAIELNPNDATAYSNRGRAKYYLGDRQGARKDFLKAKRLLQTPNPEGDNE